MRCRTLILAGCLLALAYQPAGAQSSGSSSKSTEPTEIGGKSVRQWMQEIESKDPSVRETAIRALPYFGKAAKVAAEPLTRVVRHDPDAACRVHAALALAALADYITGDEATAAIKELTNRADQDPQAIVRFHVVLALGAFGPKATAAIPVLAVRIRDTSSWELRRAAVGALANIATDTKFGPDARAVTAIANLLLNGEEKSGQVRMEAVMGLGGMGRPVQQKDFLLAVKALQLATRDPDKPVAIWATVALMAVDKVTDQGLKDVAKHLTGKDVMAKVHAARALAAMGKESKSKVHDVVALLDDKDPIAVAAAIEALASWGSTARDAVPELEKLKKKEGQTEYFKQAAQNAIEQINGKPNK
jgi:hypothetical protein